MSRPVTADPSGRNPPSLAPPVRLMVGRTKLASSVEGS
eukprot:CAMPEP_0197692456 /NCGR_PEP_ID=MMETSP1338-20131121/111125_1 /TAXON_ID=43686 ORGANISM="Pelagodinium beii, Strain RCC1491" /NCGR_SAMPLE_ID=MMETSP1338 /ASSEMBLY_ACC=CAM_ASM_000754 /LENGTH=37 /DNA_ID= /DNA_START= /DNA_END= /DNA_ORIENTATION=